MSNFIRCNQTWNRSPARREQLEGNGLDVFRGEGYSQTTSIVEQSGVGVRRNLRCAVASASLIVVLVLSPEASHASVIAPLVYPFAYPISGTYGGNGVGGSHEGYDIFGWKPNTPIVSSHSGTVEFIEFNSPGSWCGAPSNPGIYVRINHGLYRSRYHHLALIRPGLSVGQTVAPGQIIGWEGVTGNGGCAEHLHVEWRVNSSSQPIDFNAHIPAGISVASGSPITFTGEWHLNAAADGTTDKVVYLGQRGDIPIVGDWDGNGRDSVGVVRFNPAYGGVYGGYEWFITNQDLATIASGLVLSAFNAAPGYGGDADVIMPGDWDNNNTDTPGIVRLEGVDAHWYPSNAFGAGPFTNTVYGSGCGATCFFVSGDWDANGVDSYGLFSPSVALWQLTNSVTSPPVNYSFYWGNPTDLLLSGDWSLNNQDRSLLYRPSQVGAASEFFRNSGLPGGTFAFNYGTDNSYPVVLNWDSDALDEYGILP